MIIKKTYVFLLSVLFCLVRQRVVLPLLFCMLLPFVLYTASLSWQRTENRVEDWIPGSFEETTLLVRFMEIFGSDEILMISWENCWIGSPELEEFREKLLKPVVIDGVPRKLYRSVITGTGLFDQLAELGMSDDEIYTKLEGWIVSPKDDTTCVLAIISSEGMVYRREAIALVESSANSIAGLSYSSIHAAGPTMDSVAIDKASSQYILPSNLLSYILCVLLAWWCSRNLRVSLLIFGISVFNQQLCLSIIYCSGTLFNSVLMLTANLSFVLSMSMGIHYANYYRHAMKRYSVRLAPFAAMKEAFSPTLLSVLTTVMGLISFTFSSIVPIYRFGFFGAVSLLISMFVVLVFLGLSFYIMPVKTWRPSQLIDDKKTDAVIDTISPLVRWGVRFLPNLVLHHYKLILIISLLLFFVCGLGLQYSRTAVGLKNMLLPTTKPIKDYQWIESSIGPLIPVEVMLTIPMSEEGRFAESLYLVDAIQRQLQEEIQDGTVISLLNFLPELPARNNVFRKTIYLRKIEQYVEPLKETGYIQQNGENCYFRVTVRTYAMRNVDYGRLMQQVKNTVTNTLGDHDTDGTCSFFVCGGVPLVYRVQTQLLHDVKQSFLLAFVLIAAVLCIQMRSFVAGILCFFPNFLPCVIIFGLIGWLGLAMEIGTILTISAALGIAVDNAIHFINWYRKGLDKTNDSKEAVRYAYVHCGPPMIQTAIVFSVGMLVFAWNVFIPTICFAITISILLFLALVCDLLILPAILVTPLGRYFTKKSHTN